MAVLTETPTRIRRRWFAAALMPIGPAAVALLRYVLPYDTTDSPATMVAKVAADPGAQRLVVWLGLLAAFTLVPGAFAVLSMTGPRAPRLTAWTGALLIPGYLALTFLVAGDLAVLAGVDSGVDLATVTRMSEELFAMPAMTIAIAVFVVGHVFGTVLLGVALWQTQVVSRGWALAVAVSQPLHFVAAMTGNHPLDLFAWGLTAAGMAAAAVVLVRR